MKILLTNDDGIEAAGILALEAALLGHHELWVVAPDHERSANGHGFTFGRSYRVVRRGPQRYGVDGSPTDCVMFAHTHFGAFDLVISGINRGANIGLDVWYSGTVGAALEAAGRGMPAVACSLATLDTDAYHYDEAAHALVTLLQKGLSRFAAPGRVLNVNVPNMLRERIRGARLTRQGAYVHNVNQLEIEPLPGDIFQARVVQRHLHPNPEPGTDGAAVRDGCISITPLPLTLAPAQELATPLESWLEELSRYSLPWM